MKKNIIISAVLSVIANIIFPFLVAFVIGGLDGMGILLLSLFIINPIISIVIGILSSSHKKVLWYIPAANAVLFLMSFAVITGFDMAFVLYASIYFFISILAGYFTKLIKNKKAK